jgi:phosphoribosylformylglycinamidine (FGAM) synthase-like amidotransferase family enzyme
MPHPERAADPLVGGTDGLAILRSLVSSQSVNSPLLATSHS